MLDGAPAFGHHVWQHCSASFGRLHFAERPPSLSCNGQALLLEQFSFEVFGVKLLRRVFAWQVALEDAGGKSFEPVPLTCTVVLRGWNAGSCNSLRYFFVVFKCLRCSNASPASWACATSTLSLRHGTLHAKSSEPFALLLSCLHAFGTVNLLMRVSCPPALHDGTSW